MDNTHIEWTDATWNIITGCTLVSAGCDNCYAAKMAATRLKNHPSRKGLTRRNAAGVAKFTGEVRFNEKWLDQPLRWRKPRRIFVCAHGDLFHEDVPDAWIDQVFAVMALCPQHTFQVLTKRADRMREYVAQGSLDDGHFLDNIGFAAHNLDWRKAQDTMLCQGTEEDLSSIQPLDWPLPNVWLGVSAEDQTRYNKHKDHLRNTPAAVRFFSMEPLLGPIKADYLGDWVIVGGESGPNARPMHPDWARGLRDQCEAAGTAFFFKQWGEWCPGENVSHHVTGVRQNASWFSGGWDFGKTDMDDPEDGWMDEIDLYRVGKKNAGRHLDGRTWDGMPVSNVEGNSE